MPISSPQNLEFSAKHLDEMRRAATAAYWDECCGLLIGVGGDVVSVLDIRPSANLAADRSKGFAVDPQTQFDVLREVRGTSFRIIGHYHSHPNGLSRPSVHDIEMAYDPSAVWVIVPVEAGRAAAPRAFLLNRRGGYSEIQVSVLP